jgi:Fe-S-cluster containining protein
MTSPRLRSDLLREDALDDEGNTVLRDPVTLHVHRLNAIAAALAARLDGLTPLADVRDAVAVAFQLSLTDAEVLAFYQDLQTRLLLDTDAIRARLVEVAAERQAENVARLGLFEAHFSRLLEYPAESIQIREDLRYGCRGCGACCSGRFRVELTPEDEARVLALDLDRLALTPADVIQETFIPTQDLRRPRKFLRQRDGRCVFLGADNLCEIHRQFGYQHKPLGCRIFPFAPLMTPAGPLIQFRPECSTQHRTRRAGPLIEPRKHEIWLEMAAGYKAISRIPDAFPVLGDRGVTYPVYQTWEAAWVSTARADGWRAALSHIAHTLYGADPTLQRYPLTAALAALLERANQDNDHLKRSGDRMPNFFETVLPGDITADPLALPTLLYSVGGLRLAEAPAHATIAARAARLQETLPLLDTPAFDALLTDYVINFLTSKFAFHGLSLTSGLALMTLALTGSRRLVAYVHAFHDTPLDEDIVNEALLSWHLLFFSRDIIRVYLLTRRLDALERLPSVPAAWL